jgi:hypothetical protein
MASLIFASGRPTGAVTKKSPNGSTQCTRSVLASVISQVSDYSAAPLGAALSTA